MFNRMFLKIKQIGLNKAAICRGVMLITLLGSLQTSAELYKYLNEDGVTVLDSHIPARYVENGYSILSFDGKVLEVVPRALTEEEIRVRDIRLAADRERERLERERKIADLNLLRIYSTPDDVIRARNTKMVSVDGFINTSKSYLSRLETQKKQMLSQLADIERAGGKISEDRLSQIQTLEDRILKSEKEIESKRDEKALILASFAADLKRVRELTGIPGDLGREESLQPGRESSTRKESSTQKESSIGKGSSTG